MWTKHQQVLTERLKVQDLERQLAQAHTSSPSVFREALEQYKRDAASPERQRENVQRAIRELFRSNRSNSLTTDAVVALLAQFSADAVKRELDALDGTYLEFVAGHWHVRGTQRGTPFRPHY